MKDYKQLQKFIIGFLILYFLAGLSTEVFLKGREKDAPPLFSWFLFSQTPNEKTSSQYAVRILEVDGKKLDPPVFFHQAFGIIDKPNSPKPRDLIRRMGSAELMGSSEQSERFRKVFEQVYLPQSIKYDLVVITYDPITRYKTGDVGNVKILGEYTKTK